MVNLDRKEINFIGHRKVFLIISAVLIVCAALAMCVRGLTFGTEFTGGSSITYASVAEGTTEDQVRDAFSEAGYADELVVQTVSSGDGDGYLVRVDTTDVQEADRLAGDVAAAIGVADEDIQVSTIGPNWGADVIQKSLIALAVSFLLIIGYVWARYREYKMGITAVVALIHDIVIVIGVYALIGHEITPNTVAALLTIMGYSLYDTIVTFHRINENNQEGMKQSFWTVANHSINQVLRRTINTTLTSILPVLCMLALGGATLQDFALAMAIGLICGSYSSFAVATPLYAMWKNREPEIAKQNAKYGNEVNTDTPSICGYTHMDVEDAGGRAASAA